MRTHAVIISLTCVDGVITAFVYNICQVFVAQLHCEVCCLQNGHLVQAVWLWLVKVQPGGGGA
jgi:hypothetical protein